MCPITVRVRTKAVRVSTATPCIDEAGDIVRQMVLALRPQRQIKGALDDISDLTARIARQSTGRQDAPGVSFWKLRKLWNPTLQKHGFTLEADEHRDLKAAYFKFIAEQEAQLAHRLAEIRRLRQERASGETQIGFDL